MDVIKRKIKKRTFFFKESRKQWRVMIGLHVFIAVIAYGIIKSMFK